MNLATQISGKIAAADDRVLQLRRRLVALGINVRFPAGDQIIASRGGMDFTFDIEEQSIAETEHALFNAITDSSLHILHNTFQEQDGYIGQSASMETCAAMLYDKPIAALYPLVVASHVSRFIAATLAQNADALWYVNFYQLSDHDLVTCLAEVAQTKPAYRIDNKAALRAEIAAHLQSFTTLDA